MKRFADYYEERDANCGWCKEPCYSIPLSKCSHPENHSMWHNPSYLATEDMLNDLAEAIESLQKQVDSMTKTCTHHKPGDVCERSI